VPSENPLSNRVGAEHRGSAAQQDWHLPETAHFHGGELGDQLSVEQGMTDGGVLARRTPALRSKRGIFSHSRNFSDELEAQE